jgi:hypothetical protein
MRTWRLAVTLDLSLALADAVAAAIGAIRVAIAGAAPMRRTAGRAIVRARVIAGTAIGPVIAVEAAAVTAGTGRFEISTAGVAAVRTAFRTDRLRGVLHPRHVARLTALLRARFGAGLTACRSTRFPTSATTLKWHGSAAGARDNGQREHDKRAFHLSPLRTTFAAALREERFSARGPGRYDWYRRHNRQNPTNRRERGQGSDVRGEGFRRHYSPDVCR